MILLEVGLAGAGLRYCDAPYDGPGAPGRFEERMLDSSCVERHLLRGTRGRIALGNLDGRLDGLGGAALQGQGARLLAGAADGGYGGFLTLFTGFVAAVTAGRDEVVLDLCDSPVADDDIARSRTAISAGAWTGCDAFGRRRLWPVDRPEIGQPDLFWEAEAVRPLGGRRWCAWLDLDQPLPAALDLGAIVVAGDRRLLVAGLTLWPVRGRLEVALWG